MNETLLILIFLVLCLETRVGTILLYIYSAIRIIVNNKEIYNFDE